MSLSSTLYATSARANDDANSWLSWNAPRECSDTAEVERRIQSLLGGQPLQRNELQPTFVSLGWEEAHWDVSVRIGSTGAGERRVAVKSCLEVLEFVALSVALTLDPELVPPVTGDGEPTGQTEPAPQRDEENPPKAPRPPPAPQPLPHRRGAGRWHVGADAVVGLELLPKTQFGGDVRAGYGLRGLSFEVRALWLPPVRTRFDAALRDVTFGLAAGALSACTSDLTTLPVEFCLGSYVGVIAADEQDSAQRTRALWAAGEVSARAQLRVSGGVAVSASAALIAPFTRDDFQLSRGTTVHQTPPVGATLAAGVVFW